MSSSWNRKSYGAFRRLLPIFIISILILVTGLAIQYHLGLKVIRNHWNDVQMLSTQLPPPVTMLPPIPQGERKILYFHVGKTGGTTLDKVLMSNCRWYKNKWPRKNCFKAAFEDRNKTSASNETEIIEESHLSRHTIRTVHISTRGDDKIIIRNRQNVTSFLFTLRNPISRAVSAFGMDHPKNTPPTSARKWRDLFYGKCFPTVLDLASVLRAGRPKLVTDELNITVDCFKLGQDTLQGKGHIMTNTHLCKNYGSYYQLSTQQFPDREILVIRTEELWKDVKGLNLALNGTDKEMVNEGHVHSHNSEKFKVRGNLTNEGKAAICCFLSDENKIYQDLLMRAANLHDLEKRQYLHRLYSDCGIVGTEETAMGNFSWSSWQRNGCPSTHLVSNNTALVIAG